jgi:hypothetical protein
VWVKVRGGRRWELSWGRGVSEIQEEWGKAERAGRKEETVDGAEGQFWLGKEQDMDKIGERRKGAIARNAEVKLVLEVTWSQAPEQQIRHDRS